MTSTAVRLAGRAIQRAGRVRDRSFVSGLRHDAGAAVLLLSPHLDDAALDCWSLLAGDQPLGLANVFAGVPPSGRCSHWDRIVGATDSADLMRARQREDADVLASVGRTALNLPLLERPQRENRPEPSFHTLDEAVRDAVPVASRVLAPMALGTVHPDHLLLRRYALALRRGGMPVTLYADVPYATVYGWPHWVTGDLPDPHLDVDAYWQSTMDGLPALGPARVIQLADDDARAKLRALRGYRTQFPSLDRGPIRQLSNPAVHRFEVFWDVA